MKVLFDHQIFEIQKFGGISRYFFELINFCQNAGNVSSDLSVRYSENQYLKNYKPLVEELQPFPGNNEYYKKFFWGLQFRGKGRLYAFKNRYFLEPKNINPYEVNKNLTIAKLKRGDFDVFHPTYYDDYFLKYIGNKPFVVTVLDLIHQIFPEYFIGTSHVDKTRKLLNKAKRIIAISENTKRDLISIYDIEESKIKVIYLANSLSVNPDSFTIGLSNRLPKKYLLFVGNRSTYKNFYFFVQSIASLLLKDLDLFVVCTGNKFNIWEDKFIFNLGLTAKFIHVFADESELPILYTNASGFIFPSLYEGFGLPILEAFYCACPVVCSNTGSLPEVAGEGAIYFDPKNARSMVEAIELVLNNRETRESLILNGFRQLEKFSWKKMALETLDLYNKLI